MDFFLKFGFLINAMLFWLTLIMPFVLVYFLAKRFNRDVINYLFFGVVLSPFFSILLLLVLGKKVNEKEVMLREAIDTLQYYEFLLERGLTTKQEVEKKRELIKFLQKKR